MWFGAVALRGSAWDGYAFTTLRLCISSIRDNLYDYSFWGRLYTLIASEEHKRVGFSEGAGDSCSF